MDIVYLARHATPDRNDSSLPYHLPPGPPLSETGRAEARQLGHFLRQVGVRHIFCSPLLRCQGTAEIAAQVAGLHAEVCADIYEWQPGEETISVQARLQPVFERALACGSDGGPAVLVTHGGPVAALLLALGMSEETLTGWRVFDHNNPLPPAGAWRAARHGPGALWQFELVFTPRAIQQRLY